MLSDKLLTDFMHSFLGYGDLKSDVWFIGMEEGGGNDIADIEKRLSAWKELKKTRTVDLVEFHRLIDEGHRFDGENPKLQRTWAKLIRAQISFEKDRNDVSVIETSSVREFQSSRLGREKSKTCLLELLPLPSPSTNVWHYSNFSALPILQSRGQYTEEMVPKRIKMLQNLIREHSPSQVVFYGTSYAEHWANIIGEDLKWLDQRNNRSVNRIRSQTFHVTMHPTSHGVTNSMFESLLIK